MWKQCYRRVGGGSVGDHAMGTLSELQGILVVGCGIEASPKLNTQELAIAFLGARG